MERYHHTATLLPNGNVLVAAGTASGVNCCLNSAELYDSASGTFTTTGSLTDGRGMHTATLLSNGEVLVVGGRNGNSNDAIASAELYDPVRGTFSSTDSLDTAREFHSAVMLTNGKVLIATGSSIASGTIDSAELYDVGLGFSESRRPVISSSPTSQTQPGTMTLSGTGFRGDSEGSSGTTTSSATNYPLLHLQRIDNDLTLFVGSSASWTDSSFISSTLSGLPAGYYRITIFTNGMPSVQRLVSFANPGPQPQMSIGDVTVTEGNAGTTTATFTVSLSAPGGVVTVNYATADGTATTGATTSANPASITIPIAGAVTPYPSTINVAGLSGTITKVTATLNGYSHTWPRDVDVLLVGPGGQTVVLMSDAGSDQDLSGVNITFDDAAGSTLPGHSFGSGIYRPTNRADGEGDDPWGPPAPGGPYGSALSAFNATSPNGFWQLFVVDDVEGDGGSISGGWSLTFTTTTGDYLPASGTLAFPMGTTSRTISVTVNGDTTGEFNETFFVNLSGATNATILDAQGQATITNDDNASAPPNVVATATGTTSVNITWTSAPVAVSYRVYRGQRSGGEIAYSLIGSPSGTAFTDNTASASTSYLYKVHSFGPAESGDSNLDLATTVVFTDPTLVAGTTKAKLAHFTELLTAINAARTLAGLSTIAFTAPTPTTAVTIRRQHLLDLRTGINAAQQPRSHRRDLHGSDDYSWCDPDQGSTPDGIAGWGEVNAASLNSEALEFGHC